MIFRGPQASFGRQNKLHTRWNNPDSHRSSCFTNGGSWVVYPETRRFQIRGDGGWGGILQSATNLRGSADEAVWVTVPRATPLPRGPVHASPVYQRPYEKVDAKLRPRPAGASTFRPSCHPCASRSRSRTKLSASEFVDPVAITEICSGPPCGCTAN